MSIDLFSIAGIIALILLTIFFSKILTMALRLLFYALVVALVMVFFFGVSLDNFFDLLSQLLLIVF